MNRKECDNPLVSIVIPVYNGEKYLKYAIDSALAQTYKNIEILVINDGSSDGTEEIAKSYGNKIRYIKKENGGVSSALNLALKKMKGDYFSWLSHDDTYEKNKVETEINFLKKNNYIGKKVIVFSDYYLINTKGEVIGKSIKPHREIVDKPEYSLLKGHINGLSLLIPKEAFEKYGGFDTELLCTQDYVKWKEMSKTYKLIHIPEILVSTRWHSGQVTNSNPLVLTEGNAFYRGLIDTTTKKRREELEGGEYCFYKELEAFYNNSVYTDTADYCKKEAEKIFKEAKDKIAEKKVSVVIPFYNRRKEVLRAVDSVLNQTHKNFEIILVDDGSTDDLSEVEKLAKKNSNIKLYHNKENRGVSASRNFGISKSTGDYIAFLDSDDEFKPNKLEIQVHYMVASNANISHTSYERNMSDKKEIIHSGLDHGHCERKMVYNCPIATPTVMLKADWIKENKLLFNEDIEIGEDTCFWLEILRRNSYLIGIDKPLTTVNVGDSAAAYTDEKQMVGLKTIIHYLLNSDYYSEYDYEISLLMDAYSGYVKRIFGEEEPLLTGGPIYKTFFYLKTEGARSVSKRIVKKISKTIKKSN